MDLSWSLNEIYTSLDSKEFLCDIDTLDKIIEDINRMAQVLTSNKKNISTNMEKYILKFSEFRNLSGKLQSYLNLKLSVNTKDSQSQKYLDIIQNKLTEITGAITKIERYFSLVKDINKIINKSSVLKQHEFVINEIISKSKYVLSDTEETLIANMKNTGSNGWLRLKDNLVSSLIVEFNENEDIKELPLTEVLNMAYEKDPAIRRKAYEAEIKAYEKIDESVAASLNSIKGEVISICNIRGYKSPLEMTLIESRMDEESLNAMLNAMVESLPVFRNYLRRKAELLGYKNGLPFYDLFAPIMDQEMKYSYKEAGDLVESNFRYFSDNLGDYARKAIDNKWIDVMPKKGKVGGAFCEDLHSISESRILLNFGGSFSDVITMAHELGHGFHAHCLDNETILNTYCPMPIAETASTFCETLVKNSMLKQVDEKQALAILENDISDNTQVIVDIYSRFIFEKNFFKKRKNGSLTVDEIKELMIEAQKEAYGDALDHNYLHPYMWLWKPHYYEADCNYYNFPYAFGLLFSKGLYAEYLKRGSDFTKDYEKLLSITGKNSLADITKFMNIDIHDKKFWKSSLKIMEKDIEKFIELTEKLVCGD